LLLTTVPIRAPVSGRVARFKIVPGEVVQPHDRLFEVQDTRTVWVKGFLYEQDQTRIEVGRKATVTVLSYPALRFNGSVVRIAPTLDDRDRVLPVWIEVENQEWLLKEGMHADLEIMATDSAGPLAAQKFPE
jgi:multidrug resistance efflux pump